MEIVWFLLVGLIAGWLAGRIVEGGGFGTVGDIVVGIVGALIGGFIYNSLGITTYGLIGNIVMAVIGAVVLLVIVRAVAPGNHRRLV